MNIRRNEDRMSVRETEKEKGVNKGQPRIGWDQWYLVLLIPGSTLTCISDEQ